VRPVGCRVAGPLCCPCHRLLSLAAIVVHASDQRGQSEQCRRPSRGPRHDKLIARLFNGLAKITSLVLLPSKRLLGPGGHAYNRPTLAVRFSVRFRVALGSPKFVASGFRRPSSEFLLKGNARIMRMRLNMAFMVTALSTLATSLPLNATSPWAEGGERQFHGIAVTESTAARS